MRKGTGRWLLRAAMFVVVITLLAALTLWLALRGSLATLEGEQSLPGLSAPVKIERDALGVVTIDAANEADAMRALGYAAIGGGIAAGLSGLVTTLWSFSGTYAGEQIEKRSQEEW